MSKTARIVVLIIGILLLFPGACFSLVGVIVGDREGIAYLAVGVLILATAFALFYAAATRPTK